MPASSRPPPLKPVPPSPILVPPSPLELLLSPSSNPLPLLLEPQPVPSTNADVTARTALAHAKEKPASFMRTSLAREPARDLASFDGARRLPPRCSRGLYRKLSKAPVLNAAPNVQNRAQNACFMAAVRR